jgi:hypothetical protein
MFADENRWTYSGANTTVAVTRPNGGGRVNLEGNCEVATVAASGVDLLAVSWYNIIAFVWRMFESGRSRRSVVPVAHKDQVLQIHMIAREDSRH